MSIPRISISALMAVVLIVALDFGVGKALLDDPKYGMKLSELLVVGGFPMGNILMIGLAILVVGRRQPGRRRVGLIGFESFGLVAWLIFLACSVLNTDGTVRSLNGLITASQLHPGLGLVSFVTTLFLLPQVGVAMLGWWASRVGWLRLGRAFSKPRPSDYSLDLPSAKPTGV